MTHSPENYERYIKEDTHPLPSGGLGLRETGDQNSQRSGPALRAELPGKDSRRQTAVADGSKGGMQESLLLGSRLWSPCSIPDTVQCLNV